MNIEPKLPILVCATALSLVGSVGSHAAKSTFTQTFDIESVACEGLALDGVSYSFSLGGVPSLACTAGVEGPTSNNIDPPCVQFTSDGVLHLRFDHPTTSFGFGIAQLEYQPIIDSVTVDLFSPGVGMLREELFLDNTPDPEFIGGRFEYQGPAILTATIRIDDDTSNRPAAIDNITYSRPRGRSR